MSMYAEELNAAREAVTAAMRVCRRVRAEFSDAEDSQSKADHSPVTVADYAAQAVVLNRLAQSFPEIPVVAEEDAAELRVDAGAELRARVAAAVAFEGPELGVDALLDAIDRGAHSGGPTGRFWTLDPIDGTKGFIRNDQYAVALALIEDGQVVLGVLGCPNLPASEGAPPGSLYHAIRGEGSFGGAEGQDPVRLSVQATTQTAEANFCESVEAAHSAHGASAQIAEKLGITRPPYRIDSQCKYAAVARGDAAIYLRLPTRADYVEKIWDHAAGSIVVEEAGGRISDVSGNPLDFSQGRRLENNKGVIVTNGQLHDPTILAVKQVL